MSNKNTMNNTNIKEGFSLVEIIIVIAIMAILIGVIVLAVIPNIQRSQESKDLTKLDSLASVTNIVIAHHQIDKNGWFEVGGPAPTGASKTVYDAISEELGDLTNIEMESSAASGKGNIKVGWVINGGAPHIVVQIGDGNIACSYTTGEPANDEGFKLFKIENGSGDDPFENS